MTTYEKPLPVPDFDTKEFWDNTKKHKLAVPKCPVCGYWSFPPYPLCPNCQSNDRKWAELSGKGKIYSWVVVHRTGHPDFQNLVPYAVVLVQLDEQKDLRMLGNMVDCKIEDIKADMPVEAVFEDVTDEFTLVKWRPIKS